SFFFFQAEDGIRDFHVTGVQTCALPISREPCARSAGRSASALYSRNCSGSSARQPPLRFRRRRVGRSSGGARAAASIASSEQQRSEERRVGKEGRSRRSPEQ